VIVSHGVAPFTVHEQLASVVTAMLPVPPVDGTFALSGEMAKAQPLPWLTVNVWPAIVIVPDRWPPAVAGALYCTVPLPVPLAPELIVSHEALLVAVHEQPAPAVTATVPAHPADGMLAVVGEIEYVQPLPCVTVNV
jgi:hypothetical protein